MTRAGESTNCICTGLSVNGSLADVFNCKRQCDHGHADKNGRHLRPEQLTCALTTVGRLRLKLHRLGFVENSLVGNNNLLS